MGARGVHAVVISNENKMIRRTSEVIINAVDAKRLGSSEKSRGDFVLALNQAARIVPSRYVTEPDIAR